MALNKNIKIFVDHGACLSSTMCTQIASGVFELNDEMLSEAVNPDGDPIEVILEAAESCPTGAIKVQDIEAGEFLFE